MLLTMLIAYHDMLLLTIVIVAVDFYVFVFFNSLLTEQSTLKLQQ